MNPRAIIFALLVAGLILATPARAVTPEPAPGHSSPADSTAPVTDPARARAELQTVLSQPDYQEANGPDTNAQVRDWFSRWFTKMSEDFNRFEGDEHMPRFTSLLTTVFVALSIAGLIYIFARLRRRRGIWSESETTEAPAGRTFRPPEFYEEELRRAVAAGDWHEAWLASWRQFLSRLEKGRMVEADRSRTNREYLNQLRGQPLPAGATTLLPALVDSYDHFIYGRQPIGKPDWTSFQQQVNEASLLLHLEERNLDEVSPARQP